MKEDRPAGLRKKIVLGGLGFLLFVLLITTVFGKKGLIEISRARRSYAELLRQIEVLKQDKDRLEREIAELKTNAAAVDRTARKDLWLMKPDEKVLIKKTK